MRLSIYIRKKYLSIFIYFTYIRIYIITIFKRNMYNNRVITTNHEL